MLAPSALACAVCDYANAPGAASCASCGTPFGPTAMQSELALNLVPNRGLEFQALNGSSPGLAMPDTASDALPSHSSLQNGAFIIEGVLGQGGFGITYRGRDVQLKREVAIKEFFPSGCRRSGAAVSLSLTLAADDFAAARAKFGDEARLLARFGHRGIVHVYSVFEENNTAYMVMELLHGQTLSKVPSSRGGRLPEVEARSILDELAGALQTVHAEGLLHRDIKPENVIVTNDHRVVLIDFGSAKEVAIGARTQVHSIVVTPGYAPLEQYARRARRGPYTDVYALAATFYFLLSGEAPPAASDRAVGVELTPLRTFNPDLSANLTDAIERGLEIEIAKRPQSITEFMALVRGQQSTLSAANTAKVDAATHETSSGTMQTLRDDGRAGVVGEAWQVPLYKLIADASPHNTALQASLVNQTPLQFAVVEKMLTFEEAAQLGRHSPLPIVRPIPTAEQTVFQMVRHDGHLLRAICIVLAIAALVFFSVIMSSRHRPSRSFLPEPPRHWRPPNPIERPILSPAQRVNATPSWRLVASTKGERVVSITPDRRLELSGGRAGETKTLATVENYAEVIARMAPEKHLLAASISRGRADAYDRFMEATQEIITPPPALRGEIGLWNSLTGDLLWRHESPQSGYAQLTLDREEKSLYAVTDSLNPHLQVFDVTTGALTRDIPLLQVSFEVSKVPEPDRPRILMSTFSPDKRYLVALVFSGASSYGPLWSTDVYVWEARSGRLVNIVKSKAGESPYRVLALPEGRIMVVNPRPKSISISSSMRVDDLQLIDVESGKLLQRQRVLRNDDIISSSPDPSLSGDYKYVYWFSGQNTLRWWDLRRNRIISKSFSNDGWTSFLSASTLGGAKIFFHVHNRRLHLFDFSTQTMRETEQPMPYLGIPAGFVPGNRTALWFDEYKNRLVPIPVEKFKRRVPTSDVMF